MTDSSAAPAKKRRSPGRDLPAAIVVGVGLIALVVVTLTWFTWGFVLLVAVALSLAAVELTWAMRRVGMHAAMIPLVIGSAAMTILTYAAATSPASPMPWPSVLLTCLGATVLASLIGRLTKGEENFVRDAAASMFIVGYVAVLGAFVALLLAGEHGTARMVTFLLCTVASDVGGYLVGVLFGRTPLAPTLSPKKTWEGLAGSVGLAIATGIVMSIWVLQVAWWVGLILGVVVVFFGTSGDLIESAIKRDVGLKDMSNLLPGHGGVMDRLDSLLVAVAPTWLVMYLL
ncbi:MAG: phosphatidate cytidylyltransferase, partial [Propioniciclava sp.]